MNNSERPSRRARSAWLAVGGALSAGLFLFGRFLFSRSRVLSPFADAASELGGGTFLLILAASSILEGQGTSGPTLLFWFLPQRIVREDEEPTKFAIGVIVYLLLGSAGVIHGVWRVVAGHWR